VKSAKSKCRIKTGDKKGAAVGRTELLPVKRTMKKYKIFFD
jgi:hypothetical protein